MKNKFLQYLFLAFVSTFLASASYASNSKQNPLNSTYQSAYTKLEQKVKIPIYIPLKTTIKKYLDDIYINTGRITQDSYQLYFDLTPDCNGSGPCSGGSFYAAKIAPKMPNNDAVAFPTISIKTHDTVKLANGVTGYIEKEHSTGAGSSLYRTLTLDLEGSRYQLTLKGLPDKAFIALVNSMLTGSEQ